MKEHTLPSGYNINGKTLLFGEMHRHFSQTPYGETLKNNIRYSRFKPENVSNATWEKALGGDVNNLGHLTVSRGLTRNFLQNCENPIFSPHEQQTLLLTATMHDWGEAIIGDIPYIYKTKTDEKKEMIVLRNITHDIFGQEYGPQTCDKIADEVTAVLNNTTTKLGKAFNAIENVGYVRTGLRAYEQAQKTEGSLQSSLDNLGHEIVPYQMPKLLAYAPIYSPVDTYLSYHKQTITAIYEQGSEKNSLKDEAWFVKSKALWESRRAKDRPI